MKKSIYLCLALLLFLCCGPKQEKIEKYTEDGMEVIVNHLRPYKIKGEPSTLHLVEEFTIDTEDADIVKTGLTNIDYFNVDSEGSIYCLNEKCLENFILKFDQKGNFLKAFGRKGQGPGELQMPIYPVITSQEEVVIMDQGRSSLFFFTKDGAFIKSIPQDSYTIAIFPLENGNYFMVKVIYEPEGDYIMQYSFSLFSPDFKEIKELDRLRFPNYRKGRKQKAINFGFLWNITKKSIYLGNEEKGYEVRVYNLEGNLVRKLKKEYDKVRIPEEYIKEHSEGMSELWKQRTYFPEHFPPFQCAFTDDKDRLFVITNEEGSNPGENMCDIFNPEGLFIARASLTGVFDTPAQISLPPIAKKDFLYCIREKESGYQELAVFRMKWQ